MILTQEGERVARGTATFLKPSATADGAVWAPTDHPAVPVVPDEPLTGFQAAAASADGASLVCNWGSNGVEYINTDITLTLAREPDGTEIGLLATDRVEHDGIAVGTASVFDRSGPLGTVMIASLANTRRTVDLGSVTYSDDGKRQQG